jgi:AcrR family transcriptional regulator
MIKNIFWAVLGSLNPEEPMPYSAQHKQQTRTRIINSARKLFNRHGFDSVSIGEIMSDAGLTHGGFYKHFATKQDLYEAAVLQFICLDQPEHWQQVHIDPAARGEALARMIVDSYLSAEHFTERDAWCPMIALPSDVGRAGQPVQGAFRQVMEMMVGAFEANLEPRDGPVRDKALALVALVVGGMVLARAVGDPELGDAVRGAARNHAFGIAGWPTEPQARAAAA